VARAGLEESLMRSEEAATDYERVYQLAFKTRSGWKKSPKSEARQGRADDVSLL